MSEPSEQQLHDAGKVLPLTVVKVQEPVSVAALIPVSVPDWPTLKPEALYGLVGQIVKTIESHSEADSAGLLLQFLTLATKSGKLLTRPHIPMLKENNVRKGFFEQAEFEALRCLLSPPLQALITFAYITGWRIKSEVLGLEWRQVDFEAGTVRLDPGTTKNDEARVFPFTTELRSLLEAQEQEAEALQKKGRICPYVFHRNGRRIRDFRRSWEIACKAAGVPDRIPHDFRRSAVRNLVRAGVPERVAMQMTGHKTRSVFERYNIVSEGDLQTAARLLDAFSGTVESTGTVTGTVRPIRRKAKSVSR
jgi:integrase